MSSKFKRVQRKLERKNAPARVAQIVEEAREVVGAALERMADEQENAAHLAKVLAFLAAQRGEPIVVTAQELALLPEGAKLGQNYDEETDSFSFACVRPKQPQIEVVSPEQARLELNA